MQVLWSVLCARPSSLVVGSFKVFRMKHGVWHGCQIFFLLRIRISQHILNENCLLGVLSIWHNL